MPTPQQDRHSLSMAIVHALQLADAQNNHLVAALLVQALEAAEHALPG